jgi:hypothetical protein
MMRTPFFTYNSASYPKKLPTNKMFKEIIHTMAILIYEWIE